MRLIATMEKTSFIIIVTYNAMHWIDQCLKSCKGYNVVVVDNASTDKTVSKIKQDYSDAIILEQPENLGFGQANNIGIRFALTKGAKHFFLLNQDAYLQEDCLQKLVKFQQSNPEFGIVSPIHINSTKNRLDRNFSLYMEYDKNSDFYSDYVLKQSLKPAYAVPFVNAAAWLLSKNVIDTVGGFDPLFFHYGEDDNFCQRVLFHNFKIGVVPDCFIIHDREDRNKPVVKAHSDAYYALLERRIKVKYANVNNDDALAQMNTEIAQLKNNLLKLKMKAKFTKLKDLKTKLALYKRIAPQISLSRSLNIKRGTTHL